MTSTQDRPTELLEPQPPALWPPWHTSEREALQLQARRCAMDEVLPVADELDPQKSLIPASLLGRLAELGWFGTTVPAEHGGMGLGVFGYRMVSEEPARADPRGARQRRVGGHRPQALVRQRRGRRLHPGAGARARPRAGGRSASSATASCPAHR